jgi:hypothetical protein
MMTENTSTVALKALRSGKMNPVSTATVRYGLKFSENPT